MVKTLRPPKEKLEELLYSGKSVKGISDFFGVTERIVYSWLNYYNLPTPRKLKQAYKKSPEFACLVIIDYLHLNGSTEMVRQHQTRYKTLSQILHGVNIDTSLNLDTKLRLKTSWFPITRVLAQILEGELLGDGCLCDAYSTPVTQLPTDSELMNALDSLYLIRQMNEFADLTKIIQEFNESRRRLVGFSGAAFRLGKAILETAWVAYIAYLFRSNGYTCTVTTREDKKTFGEEIYHFKCVVLRTNTSFQLLKERMLNYPNGVKIVRADIVLTPRILLHWYIGDGSCGKCKISLFTHAFTLDDVKLLSQWLLRETDVFWKYALVTREREGIKYTGYELHTSSLNADAFFAYFHSDPGLNESLSIAKRLFPWKFDPKLRKKDVIDYDAEYVDENYFKTYLELLKQFAGKDYEVLAIQVFPWKFDTPLH